MIALTLFELKPERTVEDYLEYSRTYVKPGMAAMPSVLGFRDFVVARNYEGAEPSTQLVEVIEISDEAGFRRDNETGDGLAVATDWATWCTSFEVLFCEEIS